MLAETSNPQPPLYLKQARIRDYAPLRDATVNFKPGLNVIIGPNGSGKTRFLTLVSQLANMFGTNETGDKSELVFGYDADIKTSFHQLQTDEIPEGLSEEEGSVLRVRATYKEINGEGDDLYEALWESGVKPVPIIRTVLAQHGTPLSRFLLADVAATATFGQSLIMRWEPEGEFLGNLEGPLLVGYLLGALRQSLLRRRRYYRSTRSSLHEQPPALSSSEVRTEIERITVAYLEFISLKLADYSPIAKIRLSETYQVYDNPVQQEVIVKGIVFEYLVSGSWLPYQTLSDGTKRMLYLVSQLVMPEPWFEEVGAPPFAFALRMTPRLIFLEEPELGIHPAQLAKLLDLVRDVSRQNQVILTTHAPQVLDILGPDELDRITVCYLDPEKGTQFRKLSEAQQQQARAYMSEVGFLSDYWRYSYLESNEEI